METMSGSSGMCADHDAGTGPPVCEDLLQGFLLVVSQPGRLFWLNVQGCSATVQEVCSWSSAYTGGKRYRERYHDVADNAIYSRT